MLTQENLLAQIALLRMKSDEQEKMIEQYKEYIKNLEEQIKNYKLGIDRIQMQLDLSGMFIK